MKCPACGFTHLRRSESCLQNDIRRIIREEIEEALVDLKDNG